MAVDADGNPRKRNPDGTFVGSGKPDPRAHLKEILYSKHGKPLCGARKRGEGKDEGGGRCRMPAGHRTDHPGEGRCWLHGGRSQKIHGRYSSIESPRIKELLEEQENDPDPSNLLPEVKLLRALAVDYINRYEDFVDATQTWHNRHTEKYLAALEKWRREVSQALAEQGETISAVYEVEIEPPPDPKNFTEAMPRRVPDITQVAQLVDRISATVERMEKISQQDYITIEVLEHVLNVLGDELTKAAVEEVVDANIRARFVKNFERRWGSVRIDTAAFRTSAGRSAKRIEPRSES